MHHFDVETLKAGRWRNGGGATREIVSWPVGAGEFQWRASVADIDRNGPFSAFPGVDRTFALLSGDGVRLTAPGTFDRTARPEEPLAFSGDLELTAELRGGPCRALNIMARRGRRAARVDRITGPVALPDGHAAVFYVLRGHWRTGTDGRPLAAGQGVWWDEHDTTPGRAATPLSPGAVALWADIAPVA
ncbi:HutD/Ves family protein [Streptomyces exfoliatus]|uniref:HutD/Ves family protein n=1 Tax=Streptomyces exfoliatus TaxID=1905 RepID=UPI0004CB5E1F|nr:HutD family protein [Streptomyces exfoliatus]